MKIKEICTLHFPASSADESIPTAQRLADVFSSENGWSDVVSKMSFSGTATAEKLEDESWSESTPKLSVAEVVASKNKSWRNKGAPLIPRIDLKGDNLLISFLDKSDLAKRYLVKGYLVSLIADDAKLIALLEAAAVGGLVAKFKAGVLLQKFLGKNPYLVIGDVEDVNVLTYSDISARIKSLSNHNQLKVVDFPGKKDSQLTSQETALPIEVVEAVTQAFDALAGAVGVEKATELFREDLSDLLKPETFRKVKAVEGATVDEIEELVREKNVRKDWEQLKVSGGVQHRLTMEEFKSTSGKVIKESSEGSCVAITKRGNEIAMMIPFGEEETSGDMRNAELIPSTDFYNRRSYYLEQARTGHRIIVEIDEKTKAVLTQPPGYERSKLSQDEREILVLTHGFSAELVRKIVSVLRGKISILDLSEILRKHS